MCTLIRSTSSLCPLLLLAIACGPAPVPLEEGTQGGFAENSAPGTMTLPADHPPLDADGQLENSSAGAPSTFKGVVRLRGELAGDESAFVFVSVRGKGMVAPYYSRLYKLSDPQAEHGDSETVLTFELNQNYKMMSAVIPPGDLEIQARFDPDGQINIGGEDPGVVKGVVPCEREQTDIEVVLTQ